MQVEALFGVPFEALELEHVQNFLSDASGEGLTWEAKGTDPLSKLHHGIVHGVCGLANQLGGVFIIGAEDSSGSWSLPGVENNIERTSPADWIAQLLNGRLSHPVPGFAVRTWDLGDNRVAAVIHADRIPVPPCMTVDGLVFQRLVGETREVTDPRVLMDLLGRGQAVRTLAEQMAVETVRSVARRGERLSHPRGTGDVAVARAVLTIAAAGALPDYSSRLFTARMKEVLLESARSLHLSIIDHGTMGQPWIEPRRDGYIVHRGRMGFRDGWAWRIWVSWNGTVSVEFGGAREGHPLQDADEIIATAWRASISPLAALAGVPEPHAVSAHLAAWVEDTGGNFFYVLRPGTGPFMCSTTAAQPIQRWITIAEPTPEQLESVHRELARSGGADVNEP